MINYLHRLRAKKGFTLIELIVVIAIIAVLSAVIVVAVSPDTGKVKEATTAASNFYSAVQYVFTKYSKYEANLSYAVAAEIDAAKASGSDYYIEYTINMMGNYPTNKYTYICVFAENGKISYLHVNKAFDELLNDTRGTTMTAFEQQIIEDLDGYFVPSDGYYYTAVEHVEDVIDATKSRSAHGVRVHSAYFTRDQLPQVTTSLSDYREANLLFRDSSRLANGTVLGVCSSKKQSSSGNFIGEQGTYVMNFDSSLVVDDAS